MPEKRIYLGKVLKNYDPKACIADESIYLTKHSWDCGWYWGFGYIGNSQLHTHFNSSFLNASESYDIKKIFASTKIKQNEWWVIRDLFIQAYALKECAAVYRYGGHQTTLKSVTDIIRNKEIEDKINADLKIVLDKLWEYLLVINKKEVPENE